MVIRCLVLGCPNGGVIPGVSYFRLSERRYQKWMKILGRNPYEELSYTNVVCSDHFLESDKIKKKTKTYLRDDAVPCLKLKLLEHHRKQIDLSRKENTPPPMISPKIEFEYDELHYFDPDVDRVTCTPTLEVDTYTDSPPSTLPNENNKINEMEFLSSSSDSDMSLNSKRIKKDVKYLHNYSESVNNMDLPNNYIYYNVSDTIVRTKFQNGDEVQKWVTDLQEHTKITWSITRTIITPSLKARKNVFKRNYHCQFKTRTRKVTTPRLRAHASKNLDCPAQLTIIIKRQPKQKSRAAVPDNLISDWPCVITFKDNHNHTITDEAALTKRPIGEKAKQEILNLFAKGHSAASAYNTFCLKKMEELGDQYESCVADRYYFPNKSDFSNLWKAHFKSRYRERSGSEQMFAQLESNLNKSDGVLFKISHVGEHYAVSLCTPIMQRASELRQSPEILFVEAISTCDVQNHKLYFFATQSPAGGIPLGCVITSSLQGETFEVAVKNLFEIFPTQISPSVIIIDDEMVERNVLKKYWPDSVLLLSTFHILKAVWGWLCQIKNKIYREDRQVMYQLFRKILMSKTQKEMEESIKYFNTCIMCAKYPQYKNYVQNKIERDIKAWCLYFRQDLMLRGSDTNIELVFRLFKDILLERTKAYNLTQLTDFVITSFEGYYKQRLLDLVTNKLGTIFQLFPIDGVVAPEQISELDEMQYYVRSSKDNEVNDFVDMRCNICTCPQGTTGKICRHHLAIIKYCHITTACNVSPETKTTLYRIATGMEPTKEIFLPLKLENCNETNEANSNEMDSFKQITSVETLPEDNDDKSFIIERFGDIENKWSEFIYKFDADVRKNINDDPLGFSSVIERFISNYDRNVKDSLTLMTGLVTSFRYRSNSSPINSVTRKRKKMSKQPTFAARRKARIIGRRKIQAGRKIQSLRKRKTKPHSLQTCVGQGENEFKK